MNNRIIFSNATRLPVRPDRDLLRKVANRCLRAENVPVLCTVAVTFCDDEYIRQVNAEQRGIDRATDVLSFPNTDSRDGNIVYDEVDIEEGRLYLGDILISVERAVAQAEEYGHSVERELGFLLSHGMYHLMGFDHEDGSDDMFLRQEQVLAALDLRR